MVIGMFEFLLNAAYAQDAITPTGGSSNFLMQIAPLLPMFVIFYFFFIRPQRKRSLQHQQLIGGLKKGDQIVTSGGIIAFVVKNSESDPYIIAEITEKMRVKLTRDSVTGLFGGEQADSVKAPKALSAAKAVTSKDVVEASQSKPSKKTASKKEKKATSKDS